MEFDSQDFAVPLSYSLIISENASVVKEVQDVAAKAGLKLWCCSDKYYGEWSKKCYNFGRCFG